MESLYGSLLGAAAGSLAPDVQALHCGVRSIRAAGPFRVYRRARGWVDARLTLRVERDGGVERWHRWFGPTLVASTQTRAGGLLAERIGRLEFRYKVAPNGGGLTFDHLGTAVLVGRWWLPVPRALGPRVSASVRPGLRVSVEVRAPLFGRILAYLGVVEEVHGND